MKHARSKEKERIDDPLGWLGVQPDVQKQALHRAWDLAALAEPATPNETDVEDALSRLIQSLDDPTRPLGPDRPARAHRSRKRVFIASAAVAAAVLLALTLSQARIHVETRPGERTPLKLPDGSTVTLAGNSALDYPRWFFASRRHVNLDGEAFFDVSAGREVFVVATRNASVRVLGTRFNVRTRAPALPTTEIVVESGLVEIRAAHGSAPGVRVEAGFASDVTGMGATPTAPRPVDLSVALAWRSGDLSFVDAPLSAVLDDLARRFDVSIRLAGRVQTDDTVSLHLPDVRSVDAALSDICQLVPCEFRNVDMGYEVILPADL